jgi:hypothetical protein
MSTVVKYVASGTNVSNPAARRPTTRWSRFAARSRAMPEKYSSGRSSPTAIAGWNGAPLT